MYQNVYNKACYDGRGAPVWPMATFHCPFAFLCNQRCDVIASCWTGPDLFHLSFDDGAVTRSSSQRWVPLWTRRTWISTLALLSLSNRKHIPQLASIFLHLYIYNRPQHTLPATTNHHYYYLSQSENSLQTWNEVYLAFPSVQRRD